MSVRQRALCVSETFNSQTKGTSNIYCGDHVKTGNAGRTLAHQRARDRRSPLWAVTISRECDSLVSRMVIACILEHSGAKTHSVENLHEEKQIRVFGVYLMRASQSYLGQIPQDKLCTLGFKLPFPFYFFQYKSNTASLGFCSI